MSEYKPGSPDLPPRRARRGGGPGEPPAGEPVRKSGSGWLIGLALIALGGLVGWTSGSLALGSWGGPASAANSDVPDPAFVVRSPGQVVAEVERPVMLSWDIVNNGPKTWTVADYQFVPERSGLAPLPLPFDVASGETVTVQTTITLPHVHGEQLFGWILTGPDGQEVRSGHLVARVLAVDGEE